MREVNEGASARYRSLTIRTDGDDEHTFTGERLGFGTSRRDSHLHPPSQLPPPGKRCSGCRWTETALYWSDTDDQYIASIVGRSDIPSEHDKYKVVWTPDADEVLEALLVPPPRSTNRDGPLELPQPNFDALDEAAESDGDLLEALRKWQRETADAEATARVR